jgi:hypothetical protein
MAMKPLVYLRAGIEFTTSLAPLWFIVVLDAMQFSTSPNSQEKSCPDIIQMIIAVTVTRDPLTEKITIKALGDLF